MMPDQLGTGRVSGAGPGAGAPPPFTLFGGGGAGPAGALAAGALQPKLRVDESEVAQVFFGHGNVEALQHGIRYGVYRATDGAHVIGRQSDVELAVIMRSVYLQGARNVGGDRELVLAQVRALNAAVLDYAVPRVAQEVRMYSRYRADVSTLPVPLPRGELATTKGDRSLQMQVPSF